MKFKGNVTNEKRKHPIAHAKVLLFDKREGGRERAATQSDDGGRYRFYTDVFYPDARLQCTVFGETKRSSVGERVEEQDQEYDIPFDFDLDLRFNLRGEGKDKLVPVTMGTAGKRLYISVEPREAWPKEIDERIDYRWKTNPDVLFTQNKHEIELVIPPGHSRLWVEVVLSEKSIGGETGATTRLETEIQVRPAEVKLVAGEVAITGVSLSEPVGVQLHRTKSDPTLDQSLWVAIRNRTRAISFDRYQRFMNLALCWQERKYEVPEGIANVATEERIRRDLNELGIHLHGVGAYQALKSLTETFLLLECGVRIERGGARRLPTFDFEDEDRRLGRPFTLEEMERKLAQYLGERAQLPYISRVVKASFPDCSCEGWEGRLIAARINEPCLIELIWSYWMEEGMLVQTMNAVSRRFQNMRSGLDRDPLANMEITPLRPLSNLIWGYIQDEFNRLSVRRRAYEYIHHYGLTLYGKAASSINPADTRSKFLEAFHNLLFQASIFFKEDFQTTVIADGFPLLNALKEVHLILAQGAQNQFGDLPWTARVEMLLMQYMLARNEIRDFLQSRPMVPYREPWEAQVDGMKTLQGWTDVSVGQFRDLAAYGEQLLLSIRFGDWIGVNDEDSAKNWARYFRPEIQGYLHAYRAVTGIDLTNGDTVDATIPGIHLQRRMVAQRTW